MVAPNGARRTRADHPQLPIEPIEIAQTARECREAGAAALHLHVRDGSGAHTLDAGRYFDAIQAVRAELGGDLIIQITTEAVGRYRPEEQMEVVNALIPQAVSVALRELIPDAAHEAPARTFLGTLVRRGISPQFILYSADDVTRLVALVEAGVIAQARPYLLFVLGRYTAGQQSEPEDLLPFLDALGGRDWPWMMCAFGRRELECARAAIAHGGHLRVGFENNLDLPDGTLAPSNAALVALAAEAVGEAGHEVMSVAEAETLFRRAAAA